MYLPLLKISSKLNNTVNIVIQDESFMDRSRVSMNSCSAVLSPEEQPHESLLIG